MTRHAILNWRAILTLTEIDSPKGIAQLDAVRLLLREYAEAIGIDLCFQGFEEELSSLPGPYLEPRGVLLTALVNGALAGCCAMRPLDNVDYPNACEMKRLFVRRQFRGLGIGRLLAESILDAARQTGYAYILLDTLSDMEAARALYEDLGFEEIPPYYHNPNSGSHYLKARL